jgi:cobalt-zinc-cadmium efflux system protein
MGTNKNQHSHEHNHNVELISKNKMIIATALNIVITIAEIIGGIVSGSLSLLSDALHNFSDGLSLVLSYAAIKISGKEKNLSKTFGYKRSGILSASINSILLLMVSVFLIKEAIFKFIHPEKIDGLIVFGVAIIGLIANLVSVLILKKDSKENINIKSAYLHLLSDTLSSVAVIFGGLLMFFFKIYWVDPVLTLLINIYILREVYFILKKVVNILMEGVPEGIEIEEIEKELSIIEGIKNIHHIHIWGLDEKNLFLEAHVNLENDLHVSETCIIYDKISKELEEYFSIRHVTIQFEINRCEGVVILAE